jgi:hypothetical protein
MIRSLKNDFPKPGVPVASEISGVVPSRKEYKVVGSQQAMTQKPIRHLFSR